MECSKKSLRELAGLCGRAFEPGPENQVRFESTDERSSSQAEEKV